VSHHALHAFVARGLDAGGQLVLHHRLLAKIQQKGNVGFHGLAEGHLICRIHGTKVHTA
jgi:hypothetical protein